MHSVAGLVADKEGKTMKETYVKPEIIIERFSLTQNIANGCGAVNQGTLGAPLSTAKESCAWDLGGVTLFMSSGNGCMKGLDDDDVVESHCYNAPNSNVAMFGAM